MPKASPSKAPLPKKPREPKKVKDVAVNTMRVANYQAKLAVYEEEMAAYKAGQRRRKADKVAVKRRLSAGDAEPAAKRPTPVPSSCLLPRASPLAHTPPNPAPPCAHPRHRRTCPPNQARRETLEACAAGSAEAPRAPPAEPLRRLPQVLREEKAAAAAAQLRRCDGGVAASVAGELPADASKRQRALYAIKMNMAAAPEREAEATKAEAVLAPSHAAPPRRRPPHPHPPPHHAGSPPNATRAGGGGGGRLEQVQGQSSFLVAKPHPPGAAGSMVRGGCHARGAGRCGRHAVPVVRGVVR